MTPGDFLEFYNIHLQPFILNNRNGERPTYCILGKREWKYWEEWLTQQIHWKKVDMINANPTLEGVQLIKSMEESVIIFVP